MEPVVQAMQQKYGKEVTFIIVNVDEDQGRLLTANFGVNTIPAFFFITGDDKVDNNVVGPMKEADMDAAIQALI